MLKEKLKALFVSLKKFIASYTRERNDRKSERDYEFKILVTVSIGFLLMSSLFFWANQADLLKFFLAGVMSFAGGFGLGKNKKA
jgi:hypothetical protein